MKHNLAVVNEKKKKPITHKNIDNYYPNADDVKK